MKYSIWVFSNYIAGYTVRGYITGALQCSASLSLYCIDILVFGPGRFHLKLSNRTINQTNELTKALRLTMSLQVTICHQHALVEIYYSMYPCMHACM